MKRFLLAGLLGALAAPASAQPQDTMAQRMQACTACHGPQGRAAPDGYYPRIAGKPAGYLYAQLLAFRDGRRANAAMAALTAPLTDAYLREIATYFAELHLPYPPPSPARGNAAQQARGEQLVRQGDAARGVAACSACHGAQLAGRLPNIPGLLGLPPDYLIAQLGAWRTGTRHADAPDCMGRIAQQLSGDDVAAVAQWVAAQPAGPAPEPASNAPLPLACAPGR